MSDKYPSEEELQAIKEWDILAQPVSELVAFLESLWWMADWGCVLDGNKLELHTGGWSGNESIMDALRNHWMFWNICWVKHIRGGHFYFEIGMNFWET